MHAISIYFDCTGTLWMVLILLTLPYLKCNPVCPSSCYCNPTGAVNCSGPSITDVPKLPTRTFLLQLLNTNVSVITRQSLADRDLLLRFSLIESHLHTIHPEAFHVAPQLKSVQLSANDLSSLPARVFSPLTTLVQLHLDENQLETITPEMFEGLFELLELDLSQNKIGSLTSGIFDGMTKLHFLNLGRNSIKKLPATIFHSLTELQHLMIYNNELEMLEPGIFDRLVKLEQLKLHQNKITSLPPQVFWSLGNLKILTLSSNKLKALPEKSFYNMPQLTKLTIYNNPLLSLPDELGHMPDIKEFYLYATNLTTVPENLFANMSGLVILNFHLNEWLSELPSDLFCCLPSIKKLSLKFNNLVHLHPQLFSRLTTLNLLILNNNKLQSLPENIFHGLGQLLLIDLMNNTLKTLQGDIFQSNTKLSSLTLSGNPWDCVCTIRGIAKWIRQNPHVVLDREDVICHSPGYQMRRTISSLTDQDFDSCNARRVKSYPQRGDGLRERTTPSYTNPTSGQTSVTALPTAQPTTVLTTFKEATRHATTTPATPTPGPTHLPTTMLSISLQTPISHDLPDKELIVTTDATWNFYKSPAFYHTLVLEEGPEFVHHNFYRGWVYVWFLPSDAALTGVLMFSHILLVTTGLILILASLYYMYRLNKTMDALRLRALIEQGDKTCYQDE